MVRRIPAVVPLAAVAFVASARGDGDPASDVLYLKNVFLPYPAPSAAASHALIGAVAAVYAKRYRIKVAVVETPPDLGSVPELFDKPGPYAKFLGTELRQFYVGPLLVAMPAGLGIYDGGRSTAAEQRVLAKLGSHATGAEQLTRTSTAAVQQMLAAGALRSKDITKPFALALPSTGARGGTAWLLYGVSDDSMWARITVRITNRGDARVGRVTTPLQLLKQQQRVQKLAWHVPRSAPSHLRFCVVAADATGNRSPAACAPLTVR